MQLRAVAEIAPKSLFFCVNRDSLQYGFRAGAKLSGTERFHGLVFTHVASIYEANLLEQKKAFVEEKSSTPSGLVWYTNMAAVSLFWDTNMAAVTSCENTL